MEPYESGDEKPIVRKHPKTYERGAIRDNKEPLDSIRRNYEPVETFLDRKRSEDIQELTAKEDTQYRDSHPSKKKPKETW